jgi:DNA-binding NarL/FixJ family response regulator
MSSKLKIIIVDDHDLFRAGVKVLLGKSQKVEFIGEASNGQEFLDMIDKLEPDVILMDISMPVCDGIEATRLAIKKNPDLKILTLSMFGEEEYYYKMIQSGVRGFILKSAGINELEFAIGQIAAGSPYFSEELLDFVRQNIDENKGKDKTSELSKEEVEVLQAIAKNLTDEEVAEKISKSPAQIKELRKDLMAKTGSNNTTGLIMYAIKNKVIEI